MMKIKFGSLMLIVVFFITSLTVFADDAKIDNQRIVPAATLQMSNALWFGYKSNMEYCTVSLDDVRSNLNVRTFEGKVIGKLPHGTRVWVNEYSDEWARVSVKRGRRWVAVGWVDSNYLSC